MFERGNVRRWRLTEDLNWHVGQKTSRITVTIKAGREFESSVPIWARWFISQDDPRFLLAALVHDTLLEEGYYGPLQAAAEWFDGAIAGGAPRWKAIPAYIAISINATRRA